jgi:uncharacterized protein with GYD domain
MIFIILSKWRKKPTKAGIAETTKVMEQMVKEAGVKIIGFYWTLGRYDTVFIAEGKDEKMVMKYLVRLGDIVSPDTLIAVPREEAIKFVE